MFYDEAGVGKPGNIADAGNPQITFEEVTLPNGTVVKIPGEPKYPDAFDL
jgi:predicted component of type VI protein secretion system